MGSVVRRENLPPMPAFSFSDVEREATELIARATAKAEALLAEARRQIADARSRAVAQAEADRQAVHDEAARQGRAAAFQEARATAVAGAADELRRLTQALASAVTEYERNKHGLLAVAETGLLELAVAIARRVCKTLGTQGPAPAVANARTLLKLVQHQADVEVCFHPADYELVKALPDAPQATATQHVQLVADPGVERGGCVLRTVNGTIDATLETQLDRIAAEICAGLAQSDEQRTNHAQTESLCSPQDRLRSAEETPT
jgi:flagellar assembly protein FliH